MAANTTGQWGSLLSWPFIGIHATITQDGKVMSFGTSTSGVQGATMYHDVWDPVTGTHQLIDHHLHTPTDIFCAAAIILPGTNKILIAGGDARPLGHVNQGVDDVNFFDSTTLAIASAADGEMNMSRWYPSVVSFASGQVLALGGTDFNGVGVGTPEIYTPGEGWRLLPGAADVEVGSSALYPRTWIAPSGKIYYFVNGASANGRFELKELDPAGDGSTREIATLPFATSWDSPTTMYQPGKVLIQDAARGLWVMDITGATPVFTQVATLPVERNWSNMTVMADGKVLINGGSGVANTLTDVTKTAVVWDPTNNSVTSMVDEINPRLYHASTLLLPDGSLLSLGGGAPGPANYLDGQIYKPTYLFNSSGNVATRPVITDAPTSVAPGDQFTITLDNAAAIQKLTFAKAGSVTHSFNMDSSFIPLSFTVGPNNTITVQLPESINDVTAGSWMLYAWNAQGVPSVAPMIAVQPIAELFDGIGDVTAKYMAIAATVTSLDQINFTNVQAMAAERLAQINENATLPFMVGSQADNFAAQYTSSFRAAKSGSYTFYLTSDDGARLYIDGNLVVNNDGIHSATTLSANVNLSAGIHTVEVRYFEIAGSAILDLDWAGPGFARTQMTFDGVEDNLLLNGSFDLAKAPTTAATKFAALPGWSTTGQFEVIADGFNGWNAPSGNTHLELDGQTGSISQSFASEFGVSYELSFDVAATAGSLASSRIDVLRNGALIKTISSDDTEWSREFITLTGNGGTETITFRGAAGDTDTIGGHLDGVVVRIAPTAPVNYGTVAKNIVNQVQSLVGTTAIETFAINAKSTEYAWGPTQDGTGLVIWKGDDYDILRNYDFIKFNDRTVTLAAAPPTGNTYNDIPNQVQFLTGASDDDTFVVSGNRSAYGFGPTNDGTGIVVWGATGYDLLFNFEKIKFADQTVTIGTPATGRTVVNTVGVVEHVTGTQFVDTFVVNANSADYGWGRTNDGLNHVVWSGANYDILYSWERIQFNDRTVDLLA